MAAIQPNFDPKWGALETNLREEGWSQLQIDEAKGKLTETIKTIPVYKEEGWSKEVPITKEIQEIYRKVFPKNRLEMIGSIKKEVLQFTEQKIREVIAGSPKYAKEVLEQLRQGSYFGEKLKALRLLGECDATGWFLYHNYSAYNDEERKGIAATIVRDVTLDFFEGFPTSFPMMAKILSERKLSYTSISDEMPFESSSSLAVLKRLSDLGDKKSTQELSYIFTRDKIGQDSEEVKLQLPDEKRIEGLRKLALSGHAWSQKQLASACYHQILGHDSIELREKTRREYIKELLEIEVSPNYYLQCIVRENKIGELPYGLTLEQRFAILHQKAQTGDTDAFRSLVNAYVKNKLGDDELHLSPQERTDKIKELRQYDRVLYDTFLVSYVEDHKVSELSLFSGIDLVEWLEDLAFNQKNSLAMSTLTKAYKWNEVSAIPLSLTPDQRIAKLKMVADMNDRDAQDLLLVHAKRVEAGWGVTIEGVDPDPRAVSDEDILRWALMGADQAKKLLQSSVGSVTAKTLSFLFGVRQTMALVSTTEE